MFNKKRKRNVPIHIHNNIISTNLYRKYDNDFN